LFCFWPENNNTFVGEIENGDLSSEERQRARVLKGVPDGRQNKGGKAFDLGRKSIYLRSLVLSWAANGRSNHNAGAAPGTYVPITAVTTNLIWQYEIATNIARSQEKSKCAKARRHACFPCFWGTALTSLRKFRTAGPYLPTHLSSELSFEERFIFSATNFHGDVFICTTGRNTLR